jgi:glucokinase
MKIVRKRAEIVADIIVDLSLILNPSLILLGGELGGHPVLIEFVRQQLQGGEFAVPRISSGTPGNRAVLWGGIALALNAIPSVLLPEPPM